MAPIRCCLDQTAVWHSDAARGQSTPSFDHLVGEREQFIWNCNAEGLRGPKVDHELVFGRCLHWQISRLLALEDAVDVISCGSRLADKVSAVGNQAAGADEVAERVDRGQFVPGC